MNGAASNDHHPMAVLTVHVTNAVARIVMRTTAIF
jgi:hypothetical protein